jgi:hypothetical protein
VIPDHLPDVDGDDDGSMASGYTFGYYRGVRDTLD